MGDAFFAKKLAEMILSAVDYRMELGSLRKKLPDVPEADLQTMLLWMHRDQMIYYQRGKHPQVLILDKGREIQEVLDKQKKEKRGKLK